MAKSKKDAEGKSSGGLVGLIVVTLLATGAGGGFGYFISDGFKPAIEAKPLQKAKEEPQPNVPKGAKLVELKPIIANLAEPKDIWMRVEATLVLENGVEGGDALGLQISEDLVAYLKTITLAQIEASSGFQNLREDLNERARLRGGKDVRDLAIHGLVVE